MAWIIETPNPFRPLEGMRKHRCDAGVSIWQWLRSTYPGFIEFNVPTICIVNGKPRLRKEWDEPIQEDDVVNFVACTGVTFIIIAIVLVIVSVILSLVLAPTTPGEQPESDPVFTIKGQVNTIRLGEPIECNYGRNRIYPSLASRPFYRYQNNDQFQHSLFCIGQGSYEIEDVLIGDTSIDQFDEASYEILEPGQETTLFDVNVVTSIEVGGQTLFAFNEPERPVPDGWIGPFDVSPPTTQVHQIEIDVLFPKGLYYTSKKGQTYSMTLVYQPQVRLIDDAGAPLGPFVDLAPGGFQSFTAATMTPRRITHQYSVTEGRYEIRMRRLGNKSDQSTTGHEAVWDGLRGFVVGEQPDYGDVTLLAVKIRATNNLNARTREKFNVIATRKLPIRFEGSSGDADSAGWSEPIATRSIVWAFVDVMRANYGAQITDDSFYDWDTLWALESLYESRNEHFDWTFRDPITVWEAARTIARVGRGVPLLVGSLISLKRDAPATVPVGMFIPDNIVQGTFQWDIKLWDLQEHDSIQIEYTDPTTGYKQETVHCILPNDSDGGANPRDMRLPGCQDRQHAYREGMYILATERYMRENITFETGMEGIIPSYGDLIAVVHDVPNWGQSGYILDAQELTDGTWLLCVSEPLVFSDASDGANQIMLRNNRAELIGPLNVEETTDPKEIIVHLDGGEGSDFSFLLGGQNEPMLFMFGQTGNITQYLKVVKVEPQGGERIKITAAPERSVIYSFDELIAPELDKPTGPPVVPDAPEITTLTLTQVESTLMMVQAVWSATFGAQSYIVQISRGEDNWEFLTQTPRTSVQFQAWPGPVYVRVAAINEGQGPWIESSITLTLTLGLEVHIPWECLRWGIRWWEDINIDAYLIRVYDNTIESAPVLKRTTQQTELEFIYTYEMALEDGNLSNEMLVTVDTMNYDIDGVLIANELARELTLSNDAPEAMTEDSSGAFPGIELVSVSSDGLTCTWRLFWDNPPACDLHCFLLWLSLTETFDTDTETPYTEECVSEPGASPDVPTETFVTTELDSDLTHPDYFWWLALRDAWGAVGPAAGPFLLAPEWILEFNTWEEFGRWEDDNFWRD